MNVGQLQTRLLLRLKDRVRNGELTERSFARTVGISQPHIHNVLKGAKSLSIDRLDSLLGMLDLSLLDFLTEPELMQQLAKIQEFRSASVELPLLAAPVGPGQIWEPEVCWGERRLVPCRGLGPTRGMVLARLTPDPTMVHSEEGLNLAAISLDDGRALDRHSIYLVDRGPDAILRYVRRGRNKLYLFNDSDRNDPIKWEGISLTDSPLYPAIRGRVVWFGKE